MEGPECCIDCENLIVYAYEDGIVKTKCRLTNTINTDIEMLVNCPLKEA